MRADKNKIAPLVKTARGQADAALKMIEDDRYCMDVANQLAAAEALLKKARHAVLRAHLEGCVQEAFACGDDAERSLKLDEIIKLLDRTE